MTLQDLGLITKIIGVLLVRIFRLPDIGVCELPGERLG